MKRIFWIALPLTAFLIMVGVVVVVVLANRPLGPALSLAAAPTQVVQPTQPAAQPQAQAQPAAPASAATAFPTATAQVIGQAVAVQSEDTMNLLIFGLNLPESGPRGADAIRLVRVDFEAQDARILPMPPGGGTSGLTLQRPLACSSPWGFVSLARTLSELRLAPSGRERLNYEMDHEK